MAPHIPLYIVNAFTCDDDLFTGNPCAVCVCDEWPSDEMMLKIAQQNQMAETAFIRPNENGGQPDLRWFTVSAEVNFCGYGTLSAGYVYLNHIAPSQDDITFSTKNYGDLRVEKTDGKYEISAPKILDGKDIFDQNITNILMQAKPKITLNQMWQSSAGDVIIPIENPADLISITPDFNAIVQQDYYGFILTAKADEEWQAHGYDYLYRYISPRMTNIWEDPVNGRSQSILAPYWADRLSTQTNIVSLKGRAASARGGDIFVKIPPNESLMIIGGQVREYSRGNILYP